MEGERSFGYGNLLSNKKPASVYKPSPPLSAIDRFLWGQTQNHSSNQQYNSTQSNVVKISKLGTVGGLVSTTADKGLLYGSSSTSHDASGGGYVAAGVSWEENFLDGLFVNGESLALTDDGKNPNMEMEEMKVNSMKSTFPKGVGNKRNKKATSATLIKGQWTDDEDRKLIRLVKQHGVRKWAQIAESLVGRVGKQCRERWHNHLRPDIKKDSWNEEEERILVEAHAKVGNRWAEISRFIPGRTENSIKNHWNATKRRQNSRKMKKKQSDKPQPSVLQDYIRRQNLNINTKTTIITPTPTNSSSTNSSCSTFSEDHLSSHHHQFTYFIPQVQLSDQSDDSQPLIVDQPQTYDEELLFMQNFFANNNIQPSVDYYSQISRSPTEINGANQLWSNPADPCGFSSSITDHPSFITNRVEEKDEAPTTYPFSDLYLSCLLNGASTTNSSFPTGQGYHHTNMNMNTNMNSLLSEQAFSDGRKEMDLIEMVSSSQFCR